MKKILALGMIIALLLSLGGGLALADDAAEIPGRYTLTDMDDGSGTDSSAMLQAMAALGMSATLIVEEDGSAVMDLFGETEEFQLDFAAGVVIVGETTLSYTYEDEKLSFGEDGAYFTFTKGEPEAPKSGSGVYDLYTLVSMVDGEGSDLSDELAVMQEMGLASTLKLFEDGAGELDLFGSTTALVFDFETMTASAEGEAVPFTLEDHCLVLGGGDSGATFGFQQEDPGFVGSYILTGMVNGEEELGEELAMLRALGMLPTLTIDENYEGVMNSFGEELVFQFDPGSMTATNAGDSSPYTYEYGHLTMGGEGVEMRFARVLPVEEAAD